MSKICGCADKYPLAAHRRSPHPPSLALALSRQLCASYPQAQAVPPVRCPVLCGMRRDWASVGCALCEGGGGGALSPTSLLAPTLTAIPSLSLASFALHISISVTLLCRIRSIAIGLQSECLSYFSNVYLVDIT